MRVCSRHVVATAENAHRSMRKLGIKTLKEWWDFSNLSDSTNIFDCDIPVSIDRSLDPVCDINPSTASEFEVSHTIVVDILIRAELEKVCNSVKSQLTRTWKPKVLRITFHVYLTQRGDDRIN